MALLFPRQVTNFGTYQRHSLQTRSKLIAPLARSTMKAAEEGRVDGMVVGAKADAEATRRAAANVFMFVKQSRGMGSESIRLLVRGVEEWASS